MSIRQLIEARDQTNLEVDAAIMEKMKEAIEKFNEIQLELEGEGDSFSMMVYPIIEQIWGEIYEKVVELNDAIDEITG